MEVELTNENFETEILQSSLPALVDFWAPWCGPCLMIAPVIEKIAVQYQGKLKVGKLNVDNAPETASKYGVMSIPTLLIFKDGTLMETMIGAVPKEKIEEKIKPYIG